MNDINNLKMISEMKVMADQARNLAENISDNATNSFQGILESSLDSVDEKMKTSADLKKKFVSGDPSVSLVDTVMAGKKAGLAFDGIIEVRNKLVKFYEEIMNMPV